jgi:lipid-A-disaccharide synthase
MSNIFVLVGERSADVHTAEVLKCLAEIEPHIQLWGIGGPKMQELGFEPLYPFERFAVMGFAEVLQHAGFFYKVIFRIKKELLRRKPNLVLLVDYPGLNLRIAKMAKRYGFPVLYFISPQVWAWGKNRIHKIVKYTDKIATILPFEEELYESMDGRAEFVGHPIIEEIHINLSKQSFAEKYNLDPQKKWLGFIPGSRDIEIHRILPVMVEAARTLEKDSYEFLFSYVDTVSPSLFNRTIEPVRNFVTVVEDTYELMKHSDLVVCKSGTASLETAYIGTPLIVVYKTSWISYLIARWLVRVDMIALPNIIADEKIVPELIQYHANSKEIVSKIQEILGDSHLYMEMQNNLQKIKKELGEKKASYRVVQIISSFLNETKDKEQTG